jgi:ureidoacrylate peracid hydrolase
MHKIDIPDHITQRVIERRGSAHPYADLDPSRTALIVVDLQNGFMMDDVAHALCETARDIVPNVNKLAGAVRETGGKVFWIQNTHDDKCMTEWSVLQDYTVPEKRDHRIRAMTEGSLGHQLWEALDVRAEDEKVLKYRYSCFIQGSSDLEARLRAQGYDTLLITGTVTNVCCESTARDAMMLNFKTIMVTDGNASWSDEAHNASLIAFYSVFGDIMATDELIACLHKNAEAKAA